MASIVHHSATALGARNYLANRDQRVSAARKLRSNANKRVATTRANKDFDSEVGSLQLAEGQFPRERYIATNRFKVKKGAEAKFEKRWAERKSRLAELDGFRFFTIMRRVTLSEVWSRACLHL